MSGLRLRGHRCYRKKLAQSGTLADSHPDGWETAPVPHPVRARAVLTGQGVVGGRDVLIFFDAETGTTWAEEIRGRSWEDGVDAPCNRDEAQEKKHGPT